MRDIPTKATNDALAAAEFNSIINEIENSIEDNDITLDYEGGPDSNLLMTSKSINIYALSSYYYNDSGAVNAYILTNPTNQQKCSAYFDMMSLMFKANNANTGATTININSIGLKNLTRPNGDSLFKNDIVTGKFYFIIYNETDDRFELINYGQQYIDPPGTFCYMAVASALNGYLLCDGTAYSRTTYSELFSVIGEKYGPGDGSTTFNVPNIYIEDSNYSYFIKT